MDGIFRNTDGAARSGKCDSMAGAAQSELAAAIVVRHIRRMPAPVFTALPFFVYPVRDMARACAFYTEVLGLRETARWKNQWVEFDVGNSTLALSSVIQDAQPGAKAGAAALEAPDFDAAVAWLKERGVKFLFEPADTGVCRFVRFEDPDGNHLVLHRRHDALPT